jgi:molybdenum cofactor synthesis domain-containing protein
VTADRAGPPGCALRAALLVLSDRAARGEREDRSGPALADWLAERGAQVVALRVLPDDREPIADQLRRWADGGTCDLILTCGGTGLAPRDVTPEATAAVIERSVPGLGEEMRRAGSASTPRALLSRARGGVRGRCLVLNLPGHPDAALESLASVWPILGHAVATIHGDVGDCHDTPER